MAKSNLPKTPAAFDAWLGNFHKAFAANAKAWGFTSSDVKAWNAWYKNWQKSFAAWNEFNQYAKAFNQFQNQQFNAFQAFAQGFWSQSQKGQNSTSSSSNKAKKAPARSKKTARPSTTKKSATAKTSVTKTTKPTAKKSTTKTTVKNNTVAKSNTATKPTAKKATTTSKAKSSTKSNTTKKVASAQTNAPFVWFTSAKKGVNVYVGASRNGGFSLPSGAKSAWVETRTAGGRWTKLTNGSNFPFVHNVNGTKQVFYRACWIGNNNKKGQWSTTVSYGFGNKAAA